MIHYRGMNVREPLCTRTVLSQEIVSLSHLKDFAGVRRGFSADHKLHLDTADYGVPIAALLSSVSMHASLAATPSSLISAERVTNLSNLMNAAYWSYEIARPQPKPGPRSPNRPQPAPRREG